ncbi:hypothetical protein [Xanthomonas phage X1]|nr:hypothetical protein [Xanthomonas phage X1]
MTFEDFLYEAFGVNEVVTYGTNPTADNGAFSRHEGSIHTYILFRGKKFMILFLTQDSSITFSLVSEKNLDSTLIPQKESKDGLVFYNKIFSAMNVVLNAAHAKKFQFEGETDELKDLYSKFVSNRSFLRMLKDKGWRYDGEKYEGLYLFSKVSK